MIEVCGLSTALFPFDEFPGNPSALGPCRLSPNHEGDHESAQFLEGKVIAFVKWKERSSGLELTSLSSESNLVDETRVDYSTMNPTPKFIPADFPVPEVTFVNHAEPPENFDKRCTREANRVRALDFATRTALSAYYESYKPLHITDVILEVADKFNDWLNTIPGEDV